MTPHRSRHFSKKTFLGRLTDTERAVVLGDAPATRLGKGDRPVLDQHAHSSVLIGILSGFVRADCVPDGGTAARLIDIYGPGDLLGLDDFVLGLPSHLTVRPLGRNVETVAISCAGFTAATATHERIDNLVRYTCARNSRDRDLRAAHHTLALADRVDAFLTQLGRRYGTPQGDGTLVEIPLAKRDIADALCVSTESVRTAWKQLIDRGRLQHGSDHYYLANLPHQSRPRLDINFPDVYRDVPRDDTAVGDTGGPQWPATTEGGR